MLAFINNNRNSYFLSIRHNAFLKGWLDSLTGSTTQEKLYLFCYKLTDVPTCKHCHTGQVKLKDRSFFRGFQDFCSKSCAAASPARIDRFVKTCHEKFGGGPRSTKDGKSKYDKTWLSNEPKNRESLLVAKNKRQTTCLEKYGVDHVFKDRDIQLLAQKNASMSMHSYREFISKKGNPYRIRGYEDRAIDILEETLFKEEFIADDSATPKIKYFHKGGDHNYFPDIFIEKEHKIIEVKSWYWLKKQPHKNIAIMESTLNQGFAFEFWVFSGNSRIVINNLIELKGYLLC